MKSRISVWLDKEPSLLLDRELADGKSKQIEFEFKSEIHIFVSRDMCTGAMDFNTKGKNNATEDGLHSNDHEGSII